jgi:hypothetical protein
MLGFFFQNDRFTGKVGFSPDLGSESGKGKTTHLGICDIRRFFKLFLCVFFSKKTRRDCPRPVKGFFFGISFWFFLFSLRDSNPRDTCKVGKSYPPCYVSKKCKKVGKTKEFCSRA